MERSKLGKLNLMYLIYENMKYVEWSSSTSACVSLYCIDWPQLTDISKFTLSCLLACKSSNHMYCSHLLMMIFLQFFIASGVYGRSDEIILLRVRQNCATHKIAEAKRRKGFNADKPKYPPTIFFVPFFRVNSIFTIIGPPGVWTAKSGNMVLCSLGFT